MRLLMMAAALLAAAVLGCGGSDSPSKPASTGSCCVSGTCTVTVEADCQGIWNQGGTCDPNPCPAPTSLLGEWCATRIDGALDPEGNPLVVTCTVSKWTFRADGTYSWYLHAPPWYTWDDSGTYVYANDRITFNGDVSELPAEGFVDCPTGASSFTFLDEDGDRWIYQKQ